MKYFIYSLLVLGFGLMIFNLFQMNFDDVFSEDSRNALIGVLASMCVVVTMLILMSSRAIQKKVEEQK